MTTDELTRLATLYYVDGLTQEDLSKQFSLSRAKIGRLLKRAQEEGIVEIRVRHHPRDTRDLERELIDRFGIEKAIVSVNHKDQDKQRELLAGLVASHLDRILTNDMIVAVGIGRNINAISEHAISSTQRSPTFVCAIGGFYRGGEVMNADHISRRLAARFGGGSETLYAPALVGDPAVREGLLHNDAVKPTLDKARRAHIALVGVGDINEDSIMVRNGWFSPDEIAELRKCGAVGDLMGYHFIDIAGRPVVTPVRDRVIGLGMEDLKRIPNVIAVASENTKTTAVLGALRAGVITTLATTEAIAQSIVSLEDATRNPLSTQSEMATR
ncbi:MULTISPECIES: sugar-binding transcriptional regulator [Paraburkholderia]|jgi:DNA-binding transcriptional regulator LsrR (DeoR family)|uniref:Transcriptional regulator LsrR n=1 Tax=Paraburkholderia aspalathi TaxID=1324617 RepID=A0ABN7MF15_9BURK|nr:MULTISPECIES: sugar-binding transcriptional regulator [Paraburkholderia]MBK3821073.1 sugar-binding transcriptional regulator [Paraburkholderia aspalathi]MBK3832862.1 sugar-binding transcriptional regulator [Paraburkholderia aspalathi]MBK3840556.1 sugar-binding transcriptional regulator [Paraburkholderia aspalathi]MBK3862630.1 sugar-binding transcriptional regulator [Paraburkholderia aspalathi]MCX4159198.1 sugar-binding transcriptional regulator [Paraburkholderia aspalathi]